MIARIGKVTIKKGQVLTTDACSRIPGFNSDVLKDCKFSTTWQWFYPDV